jgi:hypothetical protein
VVPGRRLEGQPDLQRVLPRRQRRRDRRLPRGPEASSRWARRSPRRGRTSPWPRGAADGMLLCLFDETGAETRIPSGTATPACGTSSSPASGRLLLDPYARAVSGTVTFGPEVLGYSGSAQEVPNEADSAPHPRVPPELRGTYAGLGHPVDEFKAMVDALHTAGVEVIRSAFFDLVAQDPVVSHTKLIAEPWDVGQADSYDLGRFPPAWREWNGRYWNCGAGGPADQQRLLPGQRDHLARLAGSGHRAARVHPAAHRAAPGAPGVPPQPFPGRSRRSRPGRRRHVADRRRFPRLGQRLVGAPRVRAAGTRPEAARAP